MHTLVKRTWKRASTHPLSTANILGSSSSLSVEVQTKGQALLGQGADLEVSPSTPRLQAMKVQIVSSMMEKHTRRFYSHRVQGKLKPRYVGLQPYPKMNASSCEPEESKEEPPCPTTRLRSTTRPPFSRPRRSMTRSEFPLLGIKELVTSPALSMAQRLPSQKMRSAGHESAMTLARKPIGKPSLPDQSAGF